MVLPSGRSSKNFSCSSAPSTSALPAASPRLEEPLVVFGDARDARLPSPEEPLSSPPVSPPLPRSP